VKGEKVNEVYWIPSAIGYSRSADGVLESISIASSEPAAHWTNRRTLVRRALLTSDF
jgi:hypothetical protein